MVNKLLAFVRRSPVNVIPLVICSLLLTAVFNIYIAKQDVDSLDKYRDTIERQYKDHQWKEIETMIKMANIASRQNSKFIASRIEADLLRNYRDLNELKSEFIKGQFSEEFHDILKDNLTLDNGAPSSIYQPSYYTLVGLNEGIISIFSNEAAVTLNASSNKNVLTWGSYTKGFPNPKLASTAVESVLSRESKIIFWQNSRSNDEVLNTHTKMDMNTLKFAYEKFGLEGLKNYSILSPSYITDNGDIFNTDDVTFMKENKNYKLVIIQSFNITEIVDRYEGSIERLEKEKTYAVTYVEDYTERRMLEAIGSAFVLFLLSILLVVLFNSEKQRQIQQHTHIKLEGDRDKEKI